MSSKNMCAVCKVPATQICAGCKNVYYCNRDHQKKHWKEGHKNNCCSFKIIVNDKYGHHIVASRDIKQNEIIMKDSPIVIGPAKTNCIYCIGCNKRIRQKSGEEYRCTNCIWPLCSKKCQDTNLHKMECNTLKSKILKENTDIHSLEKNKFITTIATLRCLLLKTVAPSKHEILKSLPIPNCTKEQEEDIKNIVVPFIQNILQLPTTEQEIIDITKVFEIYSFEILKDEGAINCKGLYPMAAFLRQDCKPNTKQTYQNENNQMILMSTVPISKGELITTTYTEILWGTLARRAYLLENKNINCQCARCLDNTELGTFLGAIFCCKCKKPHEQACPKILSTDPTNQGAIWRCEKCNHVIRGRQMVWGNDAIKSEINRIDKRIPLNLEKFLVKYKETLHNKNYHAMIVKYALTQIYGNQDGYLYSGKKIF